jgi:hypothetical protein
MSEQEYSNMTTVGVSKKTLDRINFLSRITGISQKKLLDDIIGNMFVLGANFSDLCIEYETVVSENTLTLTYTGKSRLISGEFCIAETATKKECDSKLKKALEQQIKKAKGAKA